MPTRDLSELLLRNASDNEAATAEAERRMAARYRASYREIEAQIAKVYASIGVSDDLLSAARKYGRLNAMLESIAAEYHTLTKQNIKDTEANSARAYTDAAYSTEWAYEQNLGISIRWPVLPIEAIRASVYDASSGEDFEERYKNWETKDVLAFKSIITQSLAQGHNYAKTARRVRDAVGTSYDHASLIVRTEANRAYNEGHLEIYDQLGELGIQARKRWEATLDKRTRPSHGALDGEYADDDGLFWINGESAEAPGMFSDPAEVINCRCRVVEIVDGLAPTLRRIRDVGIQPYVTFKQWAEPQGWSETKGWPKAKEAIK